MKKKTFLFLALGLAATLQAQNTPVAASTTAPADSSAPAVAATANDSLAATPVAADSSTAKAVVADSAVAAPVAAQDSAVAPVDTAKVAEAPVADTASVAKADSVVAQAPVTAQDSAVAPADTAKVAEAPVDSVIAKGEPSSTTAAPADSNVAAAPLPTKDSAKVEVAKAPANKLGDIVHGNAYNSVGNEAAAATIGSNLSSPHKMHGSKLVYFDPLAEQGVIAFGNDWTYFLSFSNENQLGLLTAGMAFGKFGFSIDYSMSKAWRYTDHADGTSETEKFTAPGTLIGATVSTNLGSFDVVLSGHYQTPYGNSLLSLPNSEQEHEAWAADGYLGLSYSGDLIYWTFGVGGMRNDSKFKSSISEIKVVDGKNYLATTKTSISDTLSNIEVVPEFSIGAAALSSENANVYLGLNASGSIVLYDEIEGLNDKHYDAYLLLSPNILGEVQLSKYFMAFGGASFNWVAAEYTTRELNNEKNEIIATVTNSTTVNLGARFEYGRAALELAFEKTFLENPFGAFSSTDGIVSSLGAFINF